MPLTRRRKELRPQMGRHTIPHSVRSGLHGHFLFFFPTGDATLAFMLVNNLSFGELVDTLDVINESSLHLKIAAVKISKYEHMKGYIHLFVMACMRCPKCRSLTRLNHVLYTYLPTTCLLFSFQAWLHGAIRISCEQRLYIYPSLTSLQPRSNE
jgi:hypothetical protein